MNNHVGRVCVSRVERRRLFLKAQRAERARTRKEHGSGYKSVEHTYADRADQESVPGAVGEEKYARAKGIRAAWAVGVYGRLLGCGAERDVSCRNRSGCPRDVASRAGRT